MLAAKTAPAGKVNESVSVAVSPPGIELPRIRKYLPSRFNDISSKMGVQMRIVKGGEDEKSLVFLVVVSFILQ